MCTVQPIVLLYMYHAMYYTVYCTASIMLSVYVVRAVYMYHVVLHCMCIVYEWEIQFSDSNTNSGGEIGAG